MAHLEEPEVIFWGHTSQVTCLAPNPNSARLVGSTGDDGQFFIWDATSGMKAIYYDKGNRWHNKMAWSHCGKTLAIASKDKGDSIVELFDIRKVGQCVDELITEALDFSFRIFSFQKIIKAPGIKSNAENKN